MGREALEYSYLIHEERIRTMIVAIRDVSEKFIVSFPGGMIFESVTRVDINETLFADAQIELMVQFLRRTPNMTWLSIRLFLHRGVNSNSAIRFISSIENLEHLKLHLEMDVQFPSVRFRNLLEFLLTSRQLPKLKHLGI